MFHMCHMDVARVSSRCCKNRSGVVYIAIVIHLCCKCMFEIFQLFYMYVASILSGCCICFGDYTNMLQEYVLNVSSVSDIYCSKCLCCKCFR
jgi:hypothetical protein